MAVVLACGRGAVLSHSSAAALLGVAGELELTVSVPSGSRARPAGIRVHRVRFEPADVRRHDRIPVTSSIRTLIDLATELDEWRIEAAINAADRLDLVDPETLRAALGQRTGRRGVPALRAVLDRHAFVLTRSELERRFLRVARRAGLPLPETGVRLNGYEVDFFWPGLRLVVETDGQRYHRTAIQQTRDRRRDQAHARAGLYVLRFSHRQVRHAPDEVVATLRDVAGRLERSAA